MKVAMARLEANKPTVMPMVTEQEGTVRNAPDDWFVIGRQHASNHIEARAEPT